MAPQPGDDVYLSLDAKLQYKTEVALQTSLVRARGLRSAYGYRTDAQAGGSVVLDPRNGQVLAMASYPTYDPSALVGGISQDVLEPADRPAGEGADQPGHPGGVSARLDVQAGLHLRRPAPGPDHPRHGRARPRLLRHPGLRRRRAGLPQDQPLVGRGGLGNVSLSVALTKSSDVYFYKLGNDIWAAHKNGALAEDAMQQQVQALGYGARTGIDLPSEVPGRLPTPAWLAAFSRTINKDPVKAADAGRWQSGQSIDLAIGQGDMLASPLQIANAYASVRQRRPPLRAPRRAQDLGVPAPERPAPAAAAEAAAHDRLGSGPRSRCSPASRA